MIPPNLAPIHVPFEEWISPHSSENLSKIRLFAERHKLYNLVNISSQRTLQAHSLVNDYMFPRGDPDKLYVTGLFMAYFFLFDYIYDVDSESPEISALRQGLSEEIPLLLEGQEPKDASPFGVALIEILSHIVGTDPAWRLAFLSELTKYVQDSVRSKELAPDSEKISIERYLKIRQRDSGVWWSAYLIEYANNHYLSESEHRSPEIQNLTRLSACCCSLLNDLFSYEKEKRTEKFPFNAIYIYIQNEHLSESQAYEKTIAYTNTLIHEFLDNASAMPSRTDTRVASYIQGLREFISCAWYWHYKCGLY